MNPKQKWKAKNLGYDVKWNRSFTGHYSQVVEVPRSWYGRSLADIYVDLQKESNFLLDCMIAEPFTRKRILWLMMQ